MANSIHCRECKTPVAFMEDYIDIDVKKIEHGILHILGSSPGGIFNTLINVDNYVNDHQPEIGNTIAETCCAQCKTMLGWKFIAVSPENMYIREERFLVKLDKLNVWNDQNADQDLGANADQDGGGNQQGVNVQDSGANADQDSGGNGDQDLGGNADEDGVVNKPDSAGNNVGQDGGGNEHEEDESCGSCDVESSVDENA